MKIYFSGLDENEKRKEGSEIRGRTGSKATKILPGTKKSRQEEAPLFYSRFPSE
jgi:hypothetical protein